MMDPHPRGLLTLLQCKCGWLEQSEQQAWTKVLQHYQETDEQLLCKLVF